MESPIISIRHTKARTETHAVTKHALHPYTAISSLNSNQGVLLKKKKKKLFMIKLAIDGSITKLIKHTLNKDKTIHAQS